MGRNNFKVLQAIPQPKNTRWQMKTLAVEITEIQTETRWMANTKYENSNRKLSSNCFYQSPQSWFHPFCASTYTQVDAILQGGETRGDAFMQGRTLTSDYSSLIHSSFFILHFPLPH